MHPICPYPSGGFLYTSLLELDRYRCFSSFHAPGRLSLSHTNRISFFLSTENDLHRNLRLNIGRGINRHYNRMLAEELKGRAVGGGESIG